MKILFLGEYSGVYTELALKISESGCEVYRISNGDGYKNFPVDLKFKLPMRPHKTIFSKIKWAFFEYLGLTGILDFLKKWKQYKTYFAGYDVVQLINPIFLSGYGSVANWIAFKYISRHNNLIYLSVFGDDYYVNKNFKEVISPENKYFNHLGFRDVYAYKYLIGLLYRRLNKIIVDRSVAILPGSEMYRTPYLWSSKCSSQIFPYPISKSKLGNPLKLSSSEPIKIFHGWQAGKEGRKGNDVMDRIIKKVVEKYGDMVQYQVVKSVPYQEYLRLFNSCHIFIDQIYSLDKGVNALLGMAAGKVVFSGFDPSALAAYEHYDGTVIGINANENEDEMFLKFCDLIENRYKIEQISINAINFVEKNHTSDYVASLYLSEWKSKLK